MLKEKPREVSARGFLQPGSRGIKPSAQLWLQVGAYAKSICADVRIATFSKFFSVGSPALRFSHTERCRRRQTCWHTGRVPRKRTPIPDNAEGLSVALCG